MSVPVVTAAGMVSAVGLDWASSCAAMRARVDGFQETEFLAVGKQPLVGAPVPLPRAWEGAKRLTHLAAGAVHDIARQVPDQLDRASLILLLAEDERPGRPLVTPEEIVAGLAEHAGFTPVGTPRVITHGRPSGVAALAEARKHVVDTGAPVVILGVDSYLTGRAIAVYKAHSRILMDGVSEGFVPGEAAAAVLISPGGPGVAIKGIGLAAEPSFYLNRDDEGYPVKPFRADGMSAAYRKALDEAGIGHDKIVLKMGDLIGETYWFKQTALAMHRIQRERSGVPEIWSLGSLLGNVGAATIPVLLGWALAGRNRAYIPPGPVLIEASSDAGACGAIITEAA